MFGLTFGWNRQKKEIDLLQKRVSNMSRLMAQQIVKRSYDAARSDRTNADWIASTGMPDYDIYTAIDVVRKRSRERLQNDGYAQQIVRMFQQNIVGPYGFKLKVKATNADGTLDKSGNAAVEQAWKEWIKPGNCSVTGRESLRQLCHIAIAGMVRDGEFILRRVRRKQYKHGVALQLILPDYLDHRNNAKLKNGNKIVMGVELDAFNKPVAYHIRKGNDTSEPYVATPTGEYERIPAEDIIHLFFQEFPNQVRGISLLAPALPTMRDQGGFDEAVIKYARAAASVMLFTTDKDSKEPTEFKGTGKDSDGNTEVEWDPLSIQDLNGKTILPFNPAFPTSEHGPFTKLLLRRIAGAVGLSYEALSNDRESVNLSSIRYGIRSEEDTWRTVQEFFTEMTMDRIYEWWLDEALAKGVIVMDRGTVLPVKAFEKFNQPLFQARGWKYMDPQVEAVTAGIEVLMGINSPRRICAERGDDYEELLQELKEDFQLAKEYGIPLVFGGGKSAFDGNHKASADAQQGKTDASSDATTDTLKFLVDSMVRLQDKKNGNGNNKSVAADSKSAEQNTAAKGGNQ